MNNFIRDHGTHCSFDYDEIFPPKEPKKKSKVYGKRQLGDVIKKMKECIPDTEISFFLALSKIERDLPYCPPDNQQPLWGQVTNIVNSRIPPPTLIKEEWHKQLIRIFMDCPDIV